MALVSYPKSGYPLVNIFRRSIKGVEYFEVRWRTVGKIARKTYRELKKADELARMIARTKKNAPEKHYLINESDWNLLSKAKEVGVDRLDTLHKTHSIDRKTVHDLKEPFLDFYKHRALRTRDDVKHRMSKIHNSFAERYIDTITTTEIEKWYLALPGGTRNKNNTLATLLTFMNRAKEWGHLPDGQTVAAARVRKIKDKWKEPEILTPTEAKHILTNVREDLIPYLTLCMFAGLRPSEASGETGERLGICWKDIDFKQQNIHIRAAVAGKTGIPRLIPMQKNLADWLRPFQQEGETPICFVKSRQMFRDDNKKKNLKLPWPRDGMRHSFCSYLLALTNDIGMVAEHAGNSPTIIRRNYRSPQTENAAEQWFNITHPPSSAPTSSAV